MDLSKTKHRKNFGPNAVGCVHNANCLAITMPTLEIQQVITGRRLTRRIVHHPNQ